VGYIAPENPWGLPDRFLQAGAPILDPWTEYTGGGVVSNPQDMVRWGRALYQGRAMEGPYLDDLLGSAVPAGGEGGRSYGLGVFIRSTALGTTYGHSGWFPGYNSILAYYPDHGIAVAFQTNTDRDVNLEGARDVLASVVLEQMGLVR
jgi:D-alanyl-D-alanine carboxypeptidase